MKRGKVQMADEQLIKICRSRMPKLFQGQELQEAYQVLDNLLLPPVPPTPAAKPKKAETSATMTLIKIVIFIAIAIVLARII